ncbi:MAG: alpha/beta hydrolase [Thermoproteota archaeon]|nr:alpha/beta hydrolase [Thermoproteota archaeon]
MLNNSDSKGAFSKVYYHRSDINSASLAHSSTYQKSIMILDFFSLICSTFCIIISRQDEHYSQLLYALSLTKQKALSADSSSHKQGKTSDYVNAVHICAGTVASMFLIVLLLIMPLTPMGYTQLPEGYPEAPGRLVSVDGFMMHLYCTGEGSPTVVLDAGLGELSLSWARVQVQLSQHTRVCSYDRAGMGWSEEGPKPRTYMRIADELHALLQAAGEQRPYVLVGHSNGAHTVRFFVQKYPSEVAGIVLEDPGLIQPREINALAEQVQRSLAPYGHLGFWRYVLSLELIKNLSQQAGIPLSSVPQEIINNIGIFYSPKSILTAADELAAIDETEVSLNATLVPGAWDDKPAIVLSADNEITRMLGTIEYHKELTSLSTRGEHIVVSSGHAIHSEHPEVVVEAIMNVVNTTRQGIQF